jgi:predicted transcriptional regulator
MGAVKWQWRSTRNKKQVSKKRKRNLQNLKGADTAAALLLQKNNHCQAALQEDNWQWAQENELLSPEEIIRLEMQ